MLEAIIAWIVGLAIVALIVIGLIAGRRRRRNDEANLFVAHSEDERLAELTELQRGQLQALHNGQQLGPDGPGV